MLGSSAKECPNEPITLFVVSIVVDGGDLSDPNFVAINI